jgi:hypothetical protein
MSCPQRCKEDLCRNEAQRAGKCWTHYNRVRRDSSARGEVRPWGRTPKALLIDAALYYLEVEELSREDAERAWDRLRVAAVRYAKTERRAKLASGYRARARERGEGGRFSPR